MTGNQEGLKVVDEKLKKFSVFGHFEDVKMDEGSKAGDILLVRMEKEWFWLIPLYPKKVSVDCVSDHAYFVRAKQCRRKFSRASGNRVPGNAGADGKRQTGEPDPGDGRFFVSQSP